MIEYLKKYGNYYNLKGLTLEEKTELEHIKLEIKKFKEIEEQENKEVVVSEGSESGSGSGSNEQSKKSSRKESIEGSEKQNESQSQSKIKSKNQSQSQSQT